MKICKKLITLLMALVILLSFTTEAFAAGSQVEVGSGSKKAKVTFTIENVLAFEGTIYTPENVGLKVQSITPKVAEDKNDDVNWIKEWITGAEGTEKAKIVCVGGSMPADVTLTVELESSTAMRNGIYPVIMEYGVTKSYGYYSMSGRQYAYVYVGVQIPDESESSSSSSSNKTPEKKEDVEPQVEVIKPEGEGADRTDMMDMLDLSVLRSALEEAEKMKTYGNLSDAELKKLQEAIDIAEEAMSSDRQAVVDDAAFNLFAVIEELGGPIDDMVAEKPRKERSGGGLLVPLIIAIAAVLGIAGILMYLYMKKKKQVKYEGAPIVDYEIGDDDLL